jgi:hypothetical protein
VGLAALAWLEGGTWVAVQSTRVLEDAKLIEMKWRWSGMESALVLDTTHVHGTSRTPYATALYSWLPQSATVSIRQVTTTGSVYEGTARLDLFGFEEGYRVTERNAPAQYVRMAFQRIAPDVFDLAVQRHESTTGEWTTEQILKFERQRQ